MSSPFARPFLHRHNSWCTHLSLMLLVILFGGPMYSARAVAQSAHVAGLVTTYGTSVANAQGTAVDVSGNIYIANADGVVYKESYSAATGTYTQTTIATTPTQSSAGIAVDVLGTNVYVSTGTGKTVEWFSGSGTNYSHVQTFSGFSGVALPIMNQSVGIYIADEGSGTIYKETWGGGRYTQTKVATGFSSPGSMTVGASGDLFVSDVLDNGTSRMTELTQSGSTYTKTLLTISGLSNVHGIAVDPVGNLYIQSGATIVEAALSAGIYTTSEFYSYNGQSLALDAAGNLYLGSTYQSSETKLTVAPSFGSVPVGTSAAQIPVTFTIDSSVTLGTPSAVTQGSVGRDFALGTGSTCTGAVEAAGTTCVVYVAFTPQTVGQRPGAVNLLSSNGTLLATALVSGIGTGPQVLFPPVPGTVYSTGLSSPRGLSFDSAGNLYLANTGVGTLLEVSLASGTWTTVGSGCPTPGAITLDGAGNIYASCNTNGTLYEIVKDTGSQIAIASGITFDDNLSIDGAGNLYVSDENSGAILKISAGTHAVTTLIAGNVGRRFVGMAIDGKGNLFAPDFNNNILYELPVGASSLVVLASGSPLSNPHTIAVDSAGNLYVSNYWGSNVYRYAVGNYAAPPVTLPIPGQTGLAIDSFGAIYTIVNNSTLQSFPRNMPPSFLFANTAVGATSASQTATLENDGNANLNFLPSTNGSNPSISSDFTVEPSSTCCPQLLSSSSPAILASGASCTDVISFTPTQAGSVSGMMITTDDSLNASGTYQSIVLTGTATVGTPVVTVVSVSAPALSPATLTAVISGSGVAPSGTATFKVATGPVVQASCTAGTSTETCTVSYPTTSLPSGQNTVSVSYAADSNYGSANGAGTLTLTADTPAISWQSPSPYVYPTPLSSAQLNATASVPGSFVYNPSAGKVLGVGAGQMLSVTFTPTDTAQYASATATVSVTVAQATPGITWPSPTAISYGTALSAAQLNATAGLAGTLAYTPAAGTVLSIGAHTLSVSFLPDDHGYTLGTQTVNLVVTGSPGFPTTAVGNTSPSVNVLVALTADATISTISVPISQGTKQEYAVGSISGCVVDGSTVNVAGTVCTVAVTFTPAYPGFRSIPLQLQTSAGQLSVGLSGLAVGSQVSFAPGIISTVAGNGNNCGGATSGCGESGVSTDAKLSQPVGLAIDSVGNIYFPDTGDNRVRMITAATGMISTVAGDGTQCMNSTNSCGDNGPASGASFNTPFGIAVDGAGDVYISDRADNRVRMVAAGTGIITTVVGTGSACSTSNCGDDGLAINATLNSPGQIALDSVGNLYIADIFDYRVRKVTALTGVITTVAGNGSACATAGCGDGGSALEANLLATGVAVDSSGNLYISDYYDLLVRKVMFSTGIISTIAGKGQMCPGGTSPCGDGGAAVNASISYAEEVAVDSAGNLYVSDSGDNRIRRVSASTGIITTVVGNGSICNATDSCGDGGIASNANLLWPKGIALDSLGNLYVSDTNNHRIRKVDVSSSSMNFATTAVGATSADSPQSTTISNIGNSGLSFAIPGIGNNSNAPAGYTVAAGSTCPQLNVSSSAAVLISGADCTLSVNFTPVVSGADNATLTLADNALNNVASVQQVTLTGTGFQNAPAITWPNPVDILYGTVLSSTQLNAAASVSGTFAYSPAAGAIPGVGTQTLTATFTPTDTITYSSSTSTRNLTVNQAMPIISWTDPASIPYGTALSSTQLNASASTAGTFVYNPALGTMPALGAETLSVTFTPTDTTDYQQATSTVALTVVQATSITALSVSSTNPAYGASVTLTASVVSGGNPANTGSLTFFDNNTSIGSGTLADGIATLSVASLPTGTNVITASYGGTPNFEASASNAISVVVTTDTTTTVLSASSTNPAYGASISLSATVTSGGSPVNGGVVKFSNGGISIGTGTLINGVAAFTLAALPTGTNSIAASYGGTANFGASASNAVSVVVAMDTTTTVLSASSMNPAYDASVSLMATVASGGSSVTGGLVNFFDAGTLIGSGPILNGVATLSVATLPTGANVITASYGGAPNFAASASNAVLVTVAPGTTTTSLSAPSTNPAYGENVALTATVTSGGSPVTSGAVTFLNNGASIGTGTITNGVATLSLATLATGTNIITASYGGTSNFGASASSAVSVIVMPPSPTAPSEIITVSTPAPVVPGGVVSAATKLMAGENYSGTMKLTCVLTSAPTGAQSPPTCSFSAAALTVVANGVASTPLIVQTTAATANPRAQASGINFWGLGGGSALACLLMFCIPSQRRRLLLMATGLLLILMIGPIGCGAGFTVVTTPSIGTPATTSGVYTFTITATDTLDPSIKTSAVVTVSVQ
jgi:sugar lactone lactonase YvrE